MVLPMDMTHDMGDPRAFRRGERVAIQADVCISGDQGFAEASLIDISRFGLSIDVLRHFAFDTVLELRFSSGHIAKGRIVWTDDFMDGIAFDTPFAAEAFATLLTALQGEVGSA